MWDFDCYFVWIASPILNLPPTSSVANYRPIFIAPVLSKMFEPLVSVRRGCFIKRRGVLPTTQVAYRRGLGALWNFVCVLHFRECIWEGAGGKDRSDRLQCRFYIVNHQGILFNLCFTGIGGSVLSVLTQFSLIGHITSCRMVVGANCIINVVSRRPQESVLGRQLFLL